MSIGRIMYSKMPTNPKLSLFFWIWTAKYEAKCWLLVVVSWDWSKMLAASSCGDWSKMLAAISLELVWGKMLSVCGLELGLEQNIGC